MGLPLDVVFSKHTLVNAWISSKTHPLNGIGCREKRIERLCWFGLKRADLEAKEASAACCGEVQSLEVEYHEAEAQSGLDGGRCASTCRLAGAYVREGTVAQADAAYPSVA